MTEHSSSPDAQPARSAQSIIRAEAAASRWLFVAIILAAVLRLYGLAWLSLRGDEVVSQYYAQLPLSDLFETLRTFWAHPPLFYLFFRAWLGLAGDSMLAFRYPAFLAGVAVVPLIYQVARLLAPSRHRATGTIAAMLAAVNPYLITDSQDARVYSIFFALCLTSFYCFLYAMRSGWRVSLWFGYVLLTALALYSHYLAMVMLAVQGVIWLIGTIARRVSVRQTLSWFAACVLVVLAFVPWAWLALPVFQGSGVGVGMRVTLEEVIARTFTGFTIGLVAVWTPLPMWAQVAAVAGFVLPLLVGISTGWVVGAKQQASQPAELSGNSLGLPSTLVYLGVPASVLFAFSILRYPMYDERYVSMALTPFLFLVARGLILMASGARWRRFGLGCTGLIILVSANSTYLYHTDPQFSKSPYWTQFVQRIAQNAKPGDILVQNYPDPALPYHLANRIPRVLLPALSGGGDLETELWLTQLPSRPGRIWLQPQESTWDEDGMVETWLDHRTWKLGEESIGLLHLSLYVPPAMLLTAYPDAQAVYGDQIRLLGWVARPLPAEAESPVDAPIPEASARTVALRADQRLELTLFWDTIARQTTAYTVFVHVYRPDGSLCVQQDNPPVAGSYPTDRWGMDEVVVDTYRLSVQGCTGAGPLGLVVGMYDPRGTKRLEVRDAAGRLLPQGGLYLAEVTVLPE
jgi:4-amino-4-deoxy-L-arabinose transferase-like glycosyltransferase